MAIRTRPRIVGYTVSNSVTVTVRDLAQLGPVLDAVVSSGVNQMNGLSFSIAEPEPLRNEARKMAVAEARTRAELYAQAAGVSLGRILSISEAGGVQPATTRVPPGSHGICSRGSCCARPAVHRNAGQYCLGD